MKRRLNKQEQEQVKEEGTQERRRRQKMQSLRSELNWREQG